MGSSRRHSARTEPIWSQHQRTGRRGCGICAARDRPSSPSKAIRVESSAAFSPDGAHVVTPSADGTALVWDLRQKPPSVVALEGHQSAVSSAAFSPDGTHIVTGSGDGTARVWRIYPDVNELIPLVRASLSRCLSQAQRDAYGLHTEHPVEDRDFIPPPTPDGRCPG